jgi:hypothetical protein
MGAEVPVGLEGWTDVERNAFYHATTRQRAGGRTDAFQTAAAIAGIIETKSAVDVWLAMAALQQASEQVFQGNTDSVHMSSTEVMLAAEVKIADGKLQREQALFSCELQRSLASHRRTSRDLPDPDCIIHPPAAASLCARVWEEEKGRAPPNEDAMEMQAAPEPVPRSLHELERALALWLRPIIGTAITASFPSPPLLLLLPTHPPPYPSFSLRFLPKFVVPTP